MRRELRDKWVSELRSGTYQQGHHCLRSADNHFCCIGVLCDIHNPGLWSDHASSFGKYLYGHTRAGYPPMGVISEMGLKLESVSTLIHMNDFSKYDFAQIADWIEQNVPVTGN